MKKPFPPAKRSTSLPPGTKTLFKTPSGKIEIFNPRERKEKAMFLKMNPGDARAGI